MKKSSLIIGIGATLLAICTALDYFEVQRDVDMQFIFWYVPMGIIAIGIAWGFFSKDFSLPQNIFAIAYLLPALVLVIFFSTYALGLFRYISNKEWLGIFRQFTLVFMVLSLCLFVMCAKGWQSKIIGTLFLIYWILALSGMILSYSLFYDYPAVDFLYMFTKYIRRPGFSIAGQFHYQCIAGSLFLGSAWLAFCAFTNRLLKNGVTK